MSIILAVYSRIASSHHNISSVYAKSRVFYNCRSYSSRYSRCFRREGDGLRATTARQHKAIGNVRYYASVVPSSGANSNNNNNKTIGEDISQQKSKIHVDSQGGSRKDESKVEKSMKLLKTDEDGLIAAGKSNKEPVIVYTNITKSKPKDLVETKSPVTAVTKKTIGQRVVAELQHYYNGFKLLFIDIGVCYKYIWRVSQGHVLTRRERRQLVRTTADLFRLVPFLVFIIVPFMEFLLPVALKLFPNMLPSTFQTQSKKIEKMRTILKGKLEMAKFLQDTIEETAVQRKGAKGESVAQFVEFMHKIRTSGESTSNVDILRYSKLFEDEITLDNLAYSQLSALCRLLEIPTVGPAVLLRFQLRLKLRQLEADDSMIENEGIDSLDDAELQEANRQRGMRSLGVPTERLKLQLTQWMDLHRNAEIPASLLLLSRTLYLPETLSAGEQLKATIKELPLTTMEEAKITISEVTGDRVDNIAKLNIIKTEELAIQDEHDERNKIAAKIESEKELRIDPSEILKDIATPIVIERKETLISSSDLENLEDALEKVADKKCELRLEENELAALKEDVSEYKENLEDLKETSTTPQLIDSATGIIDITPITESKGASRLTKRVNRLITQMEDIVQSLSLEKVEILENIENHKDQSNIAGEIKMKLDKDEDDLVSINELLSAVQQLQNVSEDSQLKYVLEVLDQDKDGSIDINDALQLLKLCISIEEVIREAVIELLGRENVHINSSHMADIIRLLEIENKASEQLELATELLKKKTALKEALLAIKK